MMESFAIRLARRDDLKRIGEIEHRATRLFETTDIHSDLNGEIFDPAELAKLIEQTQVWVACLDDVPVGFVIVLKMDDILHVEELDVTPEFGQRGIGGGLLEHVCDWAEENGFVAATLSTFRGVPWNAPFYEKHCFRVLKSEEFTPWMVRMRKAEASKGLRLETRVVMRRELS